MQNDSRRSEFISSLNLDDRSQSIRFWRNCVPPQPDGVEYEAFVQAAFATLDVWNLQKSQTVDEELARGLMGVFSILRQAAERESEVRRSITEQLVPYCLNSNLNVCGEVVSFFQFVPDLISLTACHLIQVASSSESLPGDPWLSLRGVAFRTLHRLNTKYAELKKLSPARHDFIRALFHWSRTCRLGIHADEFALLANTLIWYD